MYLRFPKFMTLKLDMYECNINIATLPVIMLNPKHLKSDMERISKKRTKNEAKTTKLDTEWKSVETTQSSPSPSVEKSTQVNPDKPEAKKSRKTSLGTKLVKSLTCFKEEKEETKVKGQNLPNGKESPQGHKAAKVKEF
ncbi:hypothetical protein Tco_0155479 [Tanacetum coccineum]